MALQKQGVKEYKRSTFLRNNEIIPTYTYVLTFDKPEILKEIKIGSMIERVEQFILAPLMCFRCQKFRYHKDICRGHQVCGKCGEHDPNRTVNEWKDVKCAEIIAVNLALDLITTTNHSKFIIFTESVSALTALKNKNLTNPLTTQIHHLFEGSESPICNAYKKRLTVEYISLECVKFIQLRKKYYQTKNLKKLFTKIISCRIVNFIKEIGMYSKV